MEDESHGSTQEVPDELRERATRPAVELRADPARKQDAIARVAEQLGMHRETLRGWVRQAEIDGGLRPAGTCWLTLEDQEPVQLHEGDFYLLGNPPHYVLGSHTDLTPLDANMLRNVPAGGALRIGSNDEDDTHLCGGHFSFDDANAPMLLELLPPLVHVRASNPRGPLLAHLTELLVAELGTSAVGGSLVLEHLAQVMFVHMLRAHADQSDRPAGWLGALNDDGIGAALRAMHGDVSRKWTLNELAAISCMSRSVFAAAFKKQVGSAPLEYLIQWRMSLARDALRRGTKSITELAAATGYESESAFSTAFRRVVGLSPRQLRDSSRDLTHRAQEGLSTRPAV